MNITSYQYIVIEGSIGAGKTSLATKLATELNATLILEQFEENSFLPKFYENPQQYAFPLELSFLASRFQQLKEIHVPSIFQQKYVADYMIDKCLIFARNTLQHDEFTLFRKLFHILTSLLPQPDLVVFLYKNPELLKQNIISRGRPYEMNIEIEYLNNIQQGYLQYFHEKQFQRVVIIDTNNIDFVHSEDHYKHLKELIFSDYPPGINHITFQ